MNSDDAAGTIIQELVKWMLEMIDKARKCRGTQKILSSTLKDLGPVVEEIKGYNKSLDRSSKELENLTTEIEEIQELVRECSETHWSRSYSLASYQDKLRERDDSLVRCMNVHVQAQMARDVKEALLKIRDLSKGHFRMRDNGIQLKGICGAPENPEFVVGLDEPLINLKMELLKDGVSILGLSGLGGSGKTTLARKLCWDEQIKGKFRENILFVTFSKRPNLKIIVQTLFEHCGYQVPEFQSDEDAINRLGFLLRQIGENPILLVLDDVWPGSEFLVENFKFQMPDYKILVTSRVAFPRFGRQIHLDPLCYDDAVTLFRHFALLNDSSSYVSDNLVQEVVRICGGSPLALKVISRSLCRQPIVVWQKMAEKWSKGHAILDSNTELLTFLKKCLDVLEDKPRIMECFMDLGLFPEDQMIPAVALIDMWEELYKLDDNGMDAMNIINELATRNLANLLVTRKAASDVDNYYNNHFLMQHDLLRELAIYQSNQEPFERRKRLIIDVKENNIPEENQQGIIGSTLSLIFPQWLIPQKQQQVTARTVSISTDESLTPKWSKFQPAEVEVLVLNLRTQKYAFPDFMAQMRKVKVLIVTNYGFHPSELNNFTLLSSLSNLKRVRLEKVSVPSLCKLKNLRKLSLFLCSTSQTFECRKIRISDALPNLTELNIDYGKDLVELPVGICDITPLRKLSITNCHKFSALPQEIGKLENLEVLRLSSCSSLEEIPNSIKRLHKLRLLDISYCISLSKLAEDMGSLCNLRKLYMTGCSRCELPVSMMDMKHLECVICDEETAAMWESFKFCLPNLRIEVPEIDINLDWLFRVRS